MQGLTLWDAGCAVLKQVDHDDPPVEAVDKHAVDVPFPGPVYTGDADTNARIREFNDEIYCLSLMLVEPEFKTKLEQNVAKMDVVQQIQADGSSG